MDEKCPAKFESDCVRLRGVSITVSEKCRDPPTSVQWRGWPLSWFSVSAVTHHPHLPGRRQSVVSAMHQRQWPIHHVTWSTVLEGAIVAPPCRPPGGPRRSCSPRIVGYRLMARAIGRYPPPLPPPPPPESPGSRRGLIVALRFVVSGAPCSVGQNWATLLL